MLRLYWLPNSSINFNWMHVLFFFFIRMFLSDTIDSSIKLCFLLFVWWLRNYKKRSEWIIGPRLCESFSLNFAFTSHRSKGSASIYLFQYRSIVVVAFGCWENSKLIKMDYSNCYSWGWGFTVLVSLWENWDWGCLASEVQATGSFWFISYITQV